MKKETSKKLTIDDLGAMMTKGFKDVYNEISKGREETKDLSDNIDNLAIMVAKGFDSVYKKFDEVDGKFAEVKNDIAEVKENLASTRRDVLSMGDKFTMKFEFHDLAGRVSVLEQKQKTKR